MIVRSWIAVLLLTNYLLVVGLGCISRPEDRREFVMVQTDVAGHAHQQCRYMRIDGLEAFLNEALASHYQNAPETVSHPLISVVYGIDAHCLPDTFCPMLNATYQTSSLIAAYQFVLSPGIQPDLDVPPWLG